MCFEVGSMAIQSFSLLQMSANGAIMLKLLVKFPITGEVDPKLILHSRYNGAVHDTVL